MDIESLNDGSSFRMLKIKQALIQGFNIDEIYQNTGIDPWFLHEISEIVKIEQSYTSIKDLKTLKKNGFSDKQIAHITKRPLLDIQNARKRKNVNPVYKVVDTCAGEFVAETPYCYSTYEETHDIEPLQGKKVMIFGRGTKSYWSRN
ncbi:MAG: hypothetical protein Ct9H300mP18_02110 [Candidatus Neomarinimicrobiota bacterium]|nr:MAG: hypothetical protein Ct9H300mP18_02110 [Candidatus Neomarinimicrobiota bacterium]